MSTRTLAIAAVVAVTAAFMLVTTLVNTMPADARIREQTTVNIIKKRIPVLLMVLYYVNAKKLQLMHNILRV
jgi:hypothetical protein